MKEILILVFALHAVCQGAPSVENKNIDSAQDAETNHTISVLNQSSAELQFVKIGEKSYYIDSTSKVNWFAAWNFCRTKKLNLVMINNAKENDELAAHLKKFSAHFWMSLIDLAKKDEWVWATTGDKATYLNWHEGEPNNSGGNEHCGEFSYRSETMKWNDLACEKELSFICEKPAHETSDKPNIIPEKSNAQHILTRAFTWTWSKVFS